MLFTILLLRNAPIEKSEVHGIHVRIKDHVVKVPDNDRQRRQHGFLKMDCQCDINSPTRQKSKHAQLEPDHQAREPHDYGAPDYGQILGLLSVAKARNPRFRLRYAEIIAEVTDDVFEVFSSADLSP